MDRLPSLWLAGPEVAVGDLQQVPGGVIEIERASPSRPLDLFLDQDPDRAQMGLPLLVWLRAHYETGVRRTCRSMWRWVVLDARGVGIEDQEHPGPHSEGGRMLREDGPKPELVGVEGAHLVEF